MAILAALYLSTALAKANIKPASIPKSEDNTFQLNYSPLDYEYAKDIELLFGELGKNQLKKKTVDSLAKYQQKDHSFSILNSSYERLKSIMAISDQDSFYKSCDIFSKNVNEYTDSIADRINISIDKHCRFLFLKRLSLLSPNINFSSRDLAYFKDASPFLATGENISELTTLLRHYKVNATEHEKLSNILIEKYIEFKIRPPSEVITSLQINTTFNIFLQNNLNLDSGSASYFQDEFQRITRDAHEAIDKGDYKQGKLHTIGAINFYYKNKNFISNKKAWVGVILAAKALFYKGRDADAIEIFNMAKPLAAKEDTSEAYFYLIWPHLINKDFKAMKSVVDKNYLEKNFDMFNSKLQYWISVALLKTGDVKGASLLFNKIVTTSPYSFYSIISLKELAILNKGTISESQILSKLITRNEPADFSLAQTSSNLKDSLKRLAVWNKISNERFATLELRYIQSLSKENTFLEASFAKTVTPQAHKEFLITNLIRLLNSQKRYITSFKVFQDTIEQSSLTLSYKLIKYIFPLNYIDLIKKNSESLDPLIIISLIRQESAFNPEAESRVGAKGLMQLMPATAKRFNRRVRSAHLGKPEINVEIGTKYLRQLVERYDGNLIYALASYNAGENRIDRWRKEIFRSDDPLATIESIPYEETRNYVKLIYRNNFFYSLLSNKSVLMVPLEETFKVAQ